MSADPGGTVELDAVDLAGGGAAVARRDGVVWFVRGALPGERVQAAATVERARIVEAEALAVLATPHPARLAAPCPHAPSCGGCDWPHVDAVAGAALKARVAAGAARGTPALAERLAAAPVQPSPAAYRLRSRLHWDPESGILGFYRTRSWRVEEIPSCRIVSIALANARPGLERSLAARCPAPVDVEWLEDLEGDRAVFGLRPSRSGPAEIDPRWLPPAGELDPEVQGGHILTDAGLKVAGWGAPEVTMALATPLVVPVGGFFQVNRHLVPWLFRRVAELAGADPTPVWDLHAGVGFLAAAARHAAPRELVLAEPFRPAARAAARNLPEARIAVGRTAESLLARHRKLPRHALVLTDPPRSGFTPTLRSRLAGWHPERVLMLSCEPATWARDTAFLLERGYRLAHLELVDLFPHSHHVEVLAVLEAA